jgi:ABC-type bacteriocin/lantibiotic exporter with double-glycine peptidase domain
VKNLGFLVVIVLVVIVAATSRSTTTSSKAGQPPDSGALHHSLMRISQLDPRQYDSTREFDIWANSACSAAAMTEIANYYGGRYRIHDLLTVESRMGVITPQLGLVEDAGIARTMAFFGFHTSWGYGRSLDHIIQLARQGEPVIVSWPPDHYQGGHLIVVTGGKSDDVLLADSSIWNRHAISRAQFLSWWEGFAAVITPQGRQA